MLKIVVADDEAFVLQSICTSINWKEIGLKLVGSCKDGMEAWHAILDENPDLVMTDIRMPGLSGLELIEKTKEISPQTVFIILSGYQEFEYARTAMQYGVRHYLIKPCSCEKQVATYLPHFISVVVMSGMIILFLSPSTGIIAKLVGLLGFKLPNLMGSASAFPHIYVWTEAWQHVGWDSILYIATLSSVDPSLYEAATMDGANKWHKIVNIDLPSLVPTATVMFILRMGSVMSVGFEKVYLLQNNLNSSSSEIISTYVYKMGLVSNQYSLSAAIGLFNNIINLVLLIAVNMIAKKVSDTSLV